MIWMIALGILAVLGSVMMLKPSARDSRLAALRFDAIKQGMQIRQFTWQPDPKKTGIHEPIMTNSYGIMREGCAKTGELRFCVVAQKGWDTEHLPEGFSWHKQGTAADAEKLKAALGELNDSLLLLEVWDNKVVLMAAEKKGATAAAYKAFLQRFL